MLSKVCRRMAILALIALLISCGGQQILSEQQRVRQDAADAQVAQILFKYELDQQASYNVRKDGFLVINFGPDVAIRVYTAVVEELRASPAIAGVRAQQSGREVCILKSR